MVFFRTQEGHTIEVDLIVTDCDGIIFDSNSLKTAAYRAAIADIENDELAERFVNEIHLADVSVARGIKFERFFTEERFAPKPEAEVKGFVDRAFTAYSDQCKAAYRSLTPKDGAVELARRVPTYVVSGGDNSELAYVFNYHGLVSKDCQPPHLDKLASLFKEIRGSGEGGGTKPHHVKEILAKEGIQPERMLFIGDGWTDFKTAQQYGIHFCFLREMSDWRSWEEQTKSAAPGTMSIFDTWEEMSAAFYWTSQGYWL